MTEVLLVHSSTDGHTRKICGRLKEVIEGQGDHVSVLPVQEAWNADLPSFDRIVIGASIRYGRHAREVYRFIERNQAVLDARPNAFFSVNAVARKPEKSEPGTNPYLRKFLKEISWQPKELAVFGGKIDYGLYGFRDRLMIRTIMWLTNGPTDPDTVVEFTRWNEVEAFGQRIAGM